MESAELRPNRQRLRQIAPHAGFMLAICLTLMAPMFFSERTFGTDWTNHLWLLSVQGDAISNGGPTLFVHADKLGVFYPFFAFYGGSLYAIAGTLSAALGGQPLIAYVVMWLFGYLMAYGGMLWLSFQGGLSGWQAHAAPIVVVTAAFYATNAYQRGAWPEFMAVSAIPLLLAAAVCMLRSSRVSFGPAAAFVVATIIFTGSHNISLLWGTIAIGALVLAAVVAIPSLRRPAPSAIVALLGLGALSIAVNAWYLLPDVAYSNRTWISGLDLLSFQAIDWFASPENLFTPLRHTPSEFGPRFAVYTQLPVLIIVWAVTAAVISVRAKVNPRVLRLAAGITVVMVVFTGLMMLHEPWRHLPQPLKLIQFSFRLESYILIALGLLVAVLLRAVNLWESRFPRAFRALSVVLVVALAFGFGEAVWQSWGPGTTAGFGTRDQATNDQHKLPRNWYSGVDYGDGSAKIVPGQALAIDPNSVIDDRARVAVAPIAGAPARTTNVAGGPYLVTVSGARAIGRTPAGFQVVQPIARGDRPVELKVRPASPAPVVLGRWISIAALAALLGLVLVGGYRALTGRMRAA